MSAAGAPVTTRSSDPIATVSGAVARELADLRETPVVVALSGGLDSCVLLHALRFSPGGRSGLTAAHFDHGMRRGSQGDAAWVRGVCRAWSVELAEGRVDPAEVAPASEDGARTVRYAFLEAVARERGAALLTAHHADDQAETVLFRVLRGTGIDGLAGIPRRRILGSRSGPSAGGRVGPAPCDGRGEVMVVRPLLSLTREEVEAYARRCRVPHRPDPTNDGRAFARNVIRNALLPLAEREVAPGARRALARLAEIAGDEEAAWSSALRFVLDAVDARGVSLPGGASAVDDGTASEPSCSRTALLDLGRPLARRVVRLLAAGCGITLDRDTTLRAMGFVETSQSGRHIELGRGVELHLRGDRVALVDTRSGHDPVPTPPTSSPTEPFE